MAQRSLVSSLQSRNSGIPSSRVKWRVMLHLCHLIGWVMLRSVISTLQPMSANRPFLLISGVFDVDWKVKTAWRGTEFSAFGVPRLGLASATYREYSKRHTSVDGEGDIHLLGWIGCIIVQVVDIFEDGVLAESDCCSIVRRMANVALYHGSPLSITTRAWDGSMNDRLGRHVQAVAETIFEFTLCINVVAIIVLSYSTEVESASNAQSR